MKAFYETRYYPTNLKVWNQSYKNVHFVPHWHFELEFIFVRRGKIQIVIEGSSHTATQGDLILCDPGLVHYSTSRHVNNELDFLIFDSALIEKKFHGFQLMNPVIYKNFMEEHGLFDSLTHLYKEVENELKKQDFLYDEVIRSLIKEFCIKLYRSTVDQDKRSQISKYEEESILFKEVIDYLELNFRNDIKLKDVASLMNMTESYFSTLFKLRTNYRFIDYLNLIRLEHAINDIYSTQKNFTEIAFSNGFNNIRTFNRVFKKYTGKTPTEFKNSYAQVEYNPNIIRKSAIKYHTDSTVNKTLVNFNN